MIDTNFFRGKRKDTGEWVFGNLKSFVYRKKQQAWIETSKNVFLVDPETVGQYIGLKDRNRIRIYNRDIVRFGTTEGHILVKEIVWDSESLCYLVGNMPYQMLRESGYIQPTKALFEVIGNSFDNDLKLLEAKNER